MRAALLNLHPTKKIRRRIQPRLVGVSNLTSACLNKRIGDSVSLDKMKSNVRFFDGGCNNHCKVSASKRSASCPFNECTSFNLLSIRHLLLSFPYVCPEPVLAK